MNTKKYLASANTTDGFVNKFKYINTNTNSFTYILKGGPGTGKSTFMKNIGKYFENKNYYVEYFYCSSDSKSLDGVRFKNISIVDGTAPHITEASIPQVKEKIVNVGQFIGEKVIEHKKEIEKFLKYKANCFIKAYLYFESLGKIFEEEKISLKKSANFSIVDDITKLIKEKSKKEDSRELFNSYIGKNGFKSFYKENTYARTFILKGNFLENENVFKELLKTLDNKNISVIKFPSIFMPSAIEAIYIVDNDTLVVSENAYNENFVNFKNKAIIEKIVKKIATNLDKAIFYHKKVEDYYVKNMDFKGLNKEEEKIIKEIESKIK